MSFLKNTEIEISCPVETCKKNFKITLGQVKNKKLINCPHCNTEIELKTEGDDLSQIDRSIDDLSKSLKDINLNITLK